MPYGMLCEMAREHRFQFDELLFVILLGVLATTLGYQFSYGNQTEHIPLVLRLLDPSYLQDDFFVESASAFGPRFYYVHVLAFFAQWLPLSLVVLAMALAVNTALAALTVLAVRDLLDGDRLAGFTAAILVVSVSSFPLGLVTDIRFPDFQSASLAIPGCLAAIWAGLRGKAVLAACLAGISSLPHPLYGIETGAIAIGTALCVGLLDPSFPPTRARLAAVLIRFLAATTILIGAALVFWVIPQMGHSGESLTTRETIDILAYFRAPHHYIPSLFPIEHYAALGFFLVAFAVGWLKWRETRAGKTSTLKFLIPPIIVLLGCFAGYLLIEVWPTRVGMTAQPFRMLYLVKWLGFLFLGWLFAGWIRGASRRPAFGWIALLGSGSAHAAIAFLSVLAERLDSRLRQASPRLPHALGPIALLAAALLLLDRAGKIEESALVAIAMGIALPLSLRTSGSWGRVVPVALVALVVLASGTNRSTQALEWRLFDPIVTWEDHRGDHADTARWALHHTPEGAVFLIPPAMGSFRILARRAVVVDFESLPFEGSAMREWRRRIRDCYGAVASGGFEAREEMDQNYREIGDEALERIAAEYDSDYAVLHAQTETSRSVLYANSTYQIVSLAHPSFHQSSDE